jgi:hypothetical protein
MFHGLFNLLHQESETHIILILHFTKFLVYSRTHLQFRAFLIGKIRKYLLGSTNVTRRPAVGSHVPLSLCNNIVTEPDYVVSDDLTVVSNEL